MKFAKCDRAKATNGNVYVYMCVCVQPEGSGEQMAKTGRIPIFKRPTANKEREKENNFQRKCNTEKLCANTGPF